MRVLCICSYHSFLYGGLFCHFHWLAMLLSYLAMRVTRMPFNNIQELYDSTFVLITRPGSSFWDAFRFGDELWQKIYKEKLEPFQDYIKLHTNTKENQVKWLLLGNENALYKNYFELS